MAIRVLFFDIGGVLLTNGWDHAARKEASDRFHLDLAEMDERHHLTYDTYESGKITLDTYLERVVFYQPRDFTPEQFKQAVLAKSMPLPGMIEYGKALKSRHHLKVGAINNEGRELHEYRVAQFGLRSLMDFFVASCYVHMRKPDEDIYRLALDLAQAEPESCAYVDDRPMFVEVARKIGLHSIHHRTLETTRNALESLGLTLP